MYRKDSLSAVRKVEEDWPTRLHDFCGVTNHPRACLAWQLASTIVLFKIA